MLSTVVLILACTGDKDLDPIHDRDGDGFSNTEEEEAGTNPDSAYSFPLEYGNYNIGLCEEPPPPATGPTEQASYEENGDVFTWMRYKEGDIVENLSLQDQYGQTVSLYQFCGQHTMLITASFT